MSSAIVNEQSGREEVGARRAGVVDDEVDVELLLELGEDGETSFDMIRNKRKRW